MLPPRQVTIVQAQSVRYTEILLVFVIPRSSSTYFIQNHMGILIHVALVDELLQKYSRGDKGHARLLGHVLVHSNLVADKRAQVPIVGLRHKLGDALCSDTTRLRADDVTVALCLCIFLQDKLGDLGAFPAARRTLDYRYLGNKQAQTMENMKWLLAVQNC